MLKVQKHQNVVSLKEIFSDFSSVIIIHYHGLTVNQITKLRKSLRKNNAHLKIVKNTLSKIALVDTTISDIHPMFNGPVGIAYSSDSISIAKEIIEFTKTNNALKVVGGVVDGKIFDVEHIKKLAELPSLDVLRGKFLGLFQEPAIQIVRIIQAPLTQIARIIQAYVDKNQ